MQLRQNSSPDALVSFSDFLLERFGLVATMQVALLASIACHLLLKQTGTEAVHVPYKGNAAALQDIMAGSIAFGVAMSAARPAR